jgi:CRP-like cAMP-binding protein
VDLDSPQQGSPAGSLDETPVTAQPATGEAVQLSTTEAGPVADEIEAIKAAGLLAEIDQNQAAVLQARMAPVKLRRGGTLFNQGDPGDRLYLIRSGKIKLVRFVDDDRENLLAVLGSGEFLGELTLFDPGPRTASAIAVADTTLLELSHEALSDWLMQYPTASLDLLRALAHRLRRANEALGDLVFSDVPGRVAKALIDLADRFGEKADRGLHVVHGLTQEELAQLVGASRETVNKALRDFAGRKWIRMEGRGLYILDPARLARRAR